MLVELLLIANLFMFAVILVLLRKGGIDLDRFKTALALALKESEYDRLLGEIAVHVKEMKDIQRSIERMIRAPTDRGFFGEVSLEAILSDSLPKDMYGVRKMLPNGKIPDAYIKSSSGLICIDSKFPLENYLKMLETTSEEEAEKYKIKFLRDVRNHLEKVARDYVRPDEGTADFAFAYIPSESVYSFLVKEGFELLREYTRKGVQVVSPLTLSHKIQIIKAGIHAKKLSEEAEKVKKELTMLSRRFANVDNLWRTFYNMHLRNLVNKAEELDNAYKEVRQEFERISEFSDDTESNRDT